MTTTTTTQLAPQPKPASHWKRNTAIGAGGFLALMIGIGAMSPTAPTSNAPTGTDTTTAAPASASPRVAIFAWYTNGGETRLNAIIGDMNNAATAGQATNEPALNKACAALQSDVEAAQAYPPIPDTEAQTDWAASLAQYARAASDCTAGTSTGNDSLLGRSTQELAAGVTAMRSATTRIQALR